MKKNNLKQISSKSIEELRNNIEKLKKEAGKLTVEISSGKKKNTSKIREIKKDIAQILTVIREKELNSA